MKLNELPKNPAGRRGGKRLGRGIGSGLGKTSGRGQKGQRARSGGYHKVGFEGGQMPLQRRLPKRGFKSPFRKVFAVLNLSDLSVFAPGSVVTIEDMRAKGLLGRGPDGVKLLGDGEMGMALTIHVDRASQSAIAKVRAAGGEVVLPASGGGDAGGDESAS